MPQPLVIEGHRHPGVAMSQVQFRLPLEALQRLQQQADRLKCSRSGLLRALSLRGLAELEQASCR
jgi:predicted DNA-binding protein